MSRKLSAEDEALWRKMEAVLGLRFFMVFPKVAKCPVCKTNENKPCILIEILGSKKDNDSHAVPFHLACLNLYYDVGNKFIVQRIGGK